MYKKIAMFFFLVFLVTGCDLNFDFFKGSIDDSQEAFDVLNSAIIRSDNQSFFEVTTSFDLLIQKTKLNDEVTYKTFEKDVNNIYKISEEEYLPDGVFNFFVDDSIQNYPSLIYKKRKEKGLDIVTIEKVDNNVSTTVNWFINAKNLISKIEISENDTSDYFLFNYDSLTEFDISVSTTQLEILELLNSTLNNTENQNEYEMIFPFNSRIFQKIITEDGTKNRLLELDEYNNYFISNEFSQEIEYGFFYSLMLDSDEFTNLRIREENEMTIITFEVTDHDYGDVFTHGFTINKDNLIVSMSFEYEEENQMKIYFVDIKYSNLTQFID